MPILSSIEHAVGSTPLVRLRRASEAFGLDLLAKIEWLNPAGSVKDRIARAMIDDAEQRGVLAKGATLIEPTSGNTGIALAMIAAARGYQLVLTMPEAMSKERVALLRAYGAEVVLTPGTLMSHAVEQAEVLGRTTPGAVLLRQFDNPANPAVHERTTAEELWTDTGGHLDALVAGIGTGGTITGIARALKRRSRDLLVIGVEPARAAVLSGRAPSHHAIQGIGAGFVPRVLQPELLDEVIAVEDDEAFEAARRVSREDGVLAGVSSGAAMAAAARLARRRAMRGKRVVVIFPDGGERYASTALLRPLA